MPPAAAAALRSLGENLAIARVRRRESQRAWARRLGVSVPTLIRMERGDPGVGAGIYVTALWLMGRVNALPPWPRRQTTRVRSRATSARR
ncbi:MAG: helix-turn-helix transcriptional regulator [Gammaproteobacteria bacterium]